MRPQAQKLTMTLLVVAALLAGLAGSDLTLGAYRIAFILSLSLLGAVFAILRPRDALLLSFSLFLWGTTKFRDRDAGALLGGDIDAQVILELVVSALLAAIIVVNVLFRSPSRRSANRLAPTEIAPLVYALLALMSVAWSIDPPITLVRGLQLLVLWAFCAVAVRVLEPEETLRVLRVSLVGYVFLAAALALTILPPIWHSESRFTWFALHPIAAGTFAGSAVILMLSEALYARNDSGRLIRRTAQWFCIGLLMGILLATRSRGPIFAFAVAAITLWVRRRVPPRAAGFVVVAAIAGAALMLRVAISSADAVQGASTGNSILDFILRGQSEQQFLGMSGRVDLWQYVVTLVRDRPTLGYGYLASRSILLERFPWAGEAHGAVAEGLLNLGVIGSFVLWGSFLVALFSAFLRTFPSGDSGDGARRNQAAIVGLLIFLLVQAFDEQGIAGIPGYEAFLFFLCSAVYGSLCAARSRTTVLPQLGSWRPIPVG